MRTILTKLSAEERKGIDGVAKVTKLKNNVDIIEDIFGFMKEPKLMDEGDITEDLIKDFVQGKFEYYLPMKKKIRGRIEFFNRILNHSYYQKFKELDTEAATTVLLEMLNAFMEMKKKKDGKDPGSKKEIDEAMKEFEDIIRYGRELFDLLDDPYFQSLMDQQPEPADSDSGEKSDKKRDDLTKATKKMAAFMGKELEIYDLSKKLEFTIRMSKTGDYNEVHFPDNGLDVDRIKDVSEISKLLPTQLALDDDVFLKKLVSKELLKKKFMQRQEKRQILYVMVDRSGSMGGIVNQATGLSRLDISKAVCVALMKKLIENEDLFYFRWFDDRCSKLYKVKTKAEAIEIMPELICGQQAGGGTNIMEAIKVASEEIKKKKEEEIELADILLISDGDATVEVERVNNMLDNQMDLHTVFINDYKFTAKDNPYSNLIQSSKNFLQTSAKEGSDVIAITNLLDRR